jgi:hypothetical protein
MTKQTFGKLTMAFAFALMLSSSATAFAQHGGTIPDPTGGPGGNGVAVHYVK